MSELGKTQVNVSLVTDTITPSKKGTTISFDDVNLQKR